jgi:hypothetical protein
MGLTARMERLLPDLTGVFRRFPVAVLAAVILCGYLLSTGSRSFFDGEAFSNALAGVFLAGGIGHLFAEGRTWEAAANWVLSAVLAISSAALVYFSAVFHTSMLFFFGGIVLLLLVAPFLRSGVKQGAVWLFNLRLALAVGLAIVVGVVFGLGVSAVVAGLNFLLNIDFGYDAYERIWTVATTLVGPVYGLSLVPKDLEEEIDLEAHQGSLLERGVSILVNYVMVPLALVYALILHAYGAKIAFLQSLPKGEIGLIVSLFAVGGTVTWLIGWPWREKGTVLLRWFMRGWFWLLPVPAVLLGIAIWRRVSDYGVTPDRYGIALVAVWTAFVFTYLTWRRNRADMRTIVGSAAVLLLVGSFGPLGAFSTTAASQVARLQVVLESVGVLKNGKVVTPLPSWKGIQSDTARSMVTALANVNGLTGIANWYEKPPELVLSGTKNWWTLSNDVALSLGIPGTSGQSSLNFSMFANTPIDHQWPGKTRFIGPLENLSIKQGITPFSGGDVKLDEKDLVIAIQGTTSRMNIVKLMEPLNAEAKNASGKRKPVVVDVDARTSLVVEQAYGQTDDPKQLLLARFWLVLLE